MAKRGRGLSGFQKRNGPVNFVPAHRALSPSALLDPRSWLLDSSSFFVGPPFAKPDEARYEPLNVAYQASVRKCQPNA
jgi:hypothetical protein